MVVTRRGYSFLQAWAKSIPDTKPKRAASVWSKRAIALDIRRTQRSLYPKREPPSISVAPSIPSINSSISCWDFSSREKEVEEHGKRQESECVYIYIYIYIYLGFFGGGRKDMCVCIVCMCTCMLVATMGAQCVNGYSFQGPDIRWRQRKLVQQMRTTYSWSPCLKHLENTTQHRNKPGPWMYVDMWVLCSVVCGSVMLR